MEVKSGEVTIRVLDNAPRQPIDTEMQTYIRSVCQEIDDIVNRRTSIPERKD